MISSTHLCTLGVILALSLGYGLDAGVLGIVCICIDWLGVLEPLFLIILFWTMASWFWFPPNCFRIGCCSNGLKLACENQSPASSRKAFSNKYLVWNSCLLSLVGPITIISAPEQLLGWSAAHTSHAVFWACSARWCCFHRDLVDFPLACACACIILAIHMSLQSGSAFSWWNCL